MPTDTTKDAASARGNEVDRVSKEIGPYLLKGWTLLDQHCPACSCPLVRSREGQTRCPACKKDLQADGTLAADANGSVGEGSLDDNNLGRAASGQSTESEAGSVNPEVEAALREQLLQSSAMRNAQQHTGRVRHPSFAQTPLQQPADGAFEVGAKQRTVSFGFGDLSSPVAGSMDLHRPAPMTISGPQSPQQEPKKAGKAAANANKGKKRDTSDLLSEKLLKGWKMLAVHCPNNTCVCPLVQNKQGKMLCVQCGSVVVRQEDFDPKKHRLANHLKNLGSGNKRSSTEQSPVGSPLLPQTPAPTPKMVPGHSLTAAHTFSQNDQELSAPIHKRQKMERTLSHNFGNLDAMDKDAFSINTSNQAGAGRKQDQIETLNTLGVDPRLIAAAMGQKREPPQTPRTSRVVAPTPPTTPAQFQTARVNASNFAPQRPDPLGAVVFHENLGGAQGVQMSPEPSRASILRAKAQMDAIPNLSAQMSPQDGLVVTQGTDACTAAEAALDAKLRQATQWLASCSDVGQTAQVAQLMTSLATALKALRELRPVL